MLFTVPGIANKTLRGLITGLLNRPYSMSQASYDLSRLVRNGLIARVPGHNRYTLTSDGLLFACLCTRVYDHVLSPADGTRPAQRAPRAHHRARSPRPARRRSRHQGTRPHRSLTRCYRQHPPALPVAAMPARPHHR